MSIRVNAKADGKIARDDLEVLGKKVGHDLN